jgi:glycosyltransferase involved in cell wall biosynthesis
MKIVHLDTGLALRGGQRQLLRLAQGLRQHGHTQFIVCPDASELEARASRGAFSVFALPAHDLGHAHGIMQLRQFLLASPCDILHAHDGRGQTLAWLASVGMPLRRVASRRVTFLPAQRWTHRWKYSVTCHAVIAVSDFIRRLLIQVGVPESKIEVIPDGIEIPAELPGAELRSKVRAQWGLGDQEFVVGHLGAFTPEKGRDLLLEAFRFVSERFRNARLLLAGEGPTRTAPSMLQRLEKLRDRVRLCGDIEELAGFYPALDLFVMPSRAEGLGSAALHAMAFGIPVVATRVGGLPEIVREAETGWLIPADSPAALAEAILAAASDTTRLRQLGVKARERAREFSTDIMLTRTERLYERLCG